jgi:hypothetical protein
MKSLVVQEQDLAEMTIHPLLNVSKNLSLSLTPPFTLLAVFVKFLL